MEGPRVVVAFLAAAFVAAAPVLGVPPGEASYVGCTSLFAGYPLPFAEAQAFLPAGFEAAPFTLDPTGATATLSVYVRRCADAAVPGGGSGPLGEAWLLVRATPPPVWRDASLTATFYVVSVATDRPDAAALYRAWNLVAAGEGNASVDLDRTPPLANVYVHRALVSSPDLAFGLTHANARSVIPWAEQTFRFLGTGPDGSLGAVDEHDRAGFQTDVQPSHAFVGAGLGEPGSQRVGVGRGFVWGVGTLSWTLAPASPSPS